MVWALWFMVVATWAWGWLGKGRMLTQAFGLLAGIWATIRNERVKKKLLLGI